MIATPFSAQIRTICCTSSVLCGKTTASGGWFAIQVTVLPCCSRTACEVTTRLPKAAVRAAIVLLIAPALRSRPATSLTAIKLSSAARQPTLAEDRLRVKRDRRRRGCGDNLRLGIRRLPASLAQDDRPMKGTINRHRCPERQNSVPKRAITA